jgi:pyruvate,water dikinase
MAVTQAPVHNSGNDAWDPLHAPGGHDEHWSTDNVGEAAPGVLSPLGWSVWGTEGNTAMYETAYRLGIFSRAECRSPHRYVRIFYGRAALQVEYLALVGDRMPGTTGEEVSKGIFGRAPDDMVWHPTRRRYPIVAARLPVIFIRTAGEIRQVAQETDAWWRAEVPRLSGLDLDGSQALFALATKRFGQALRTQSIGLLGALQPLYEALGKVIERTGVGEIAVLSGSGGAEMAIVGDIWKASRGELTVEEVIASHGFHGPREGEMSGRVWREDPLPLRRMIDEYAAQDPSLSPLAREARNRSLRAEMQRDLVAAVPRSQRPAVRFLLALAAARLPLRGVAKRAYLQSIDVCRGAARQAGRALTADGKLDDPDDIFYLTSDEWSGTLVPNARELVALRRERRSEYEQLRIPSNWTGTPDAVRIAVAGPGDARDLGPVTGLGVSAGVVEGPARVVTDPAFADVEPGDVLISSTTDPSWSSIMFISSALVVDIGSALSHAAVVARELGVPCVVNTRTGSERLRTGDVVRVDGNAGTVEILRAAP